MSIFDRFFASEPCPEPVPVRPLPAFCHRCGRQLVRDTSSVGFDETTGLPLWRNWLHCPKYKGDFVRDPGTPNGAIAREVEADWSGFTGSYWWTGHTDYINCQKYKAPKPEAEAA